MAKKARKAAGRGTGERRVALLLLPPGGEGAGPWLEQAIGEEWAFSGEQTLKTAVLPPERRRLVREIRRCADREGCHVICTVGRAGPDRGDFVPDVTRSLLDRPLPGIEERMYLGRNRVS